jgi:hypothetical protein
MEYRPARNAMMSKRISKPMELAIGDELMRFTSAQEFQFSLNGRTSVPSHKMSALMKLPKEIKVRQPPLTTWKNVSRPFWTGR